MTRHFHQLGLRAALWAFVALALPAWGADGDWETVLEGPITIKNRAVPNSAVKEIWAEGDMAAPVQDIQDTLMKPELFRSFMPYLKDSREISKKLEDGSVYVYTLIDLPVVGKRDYIVRVWLREGVKPDGTGTFRNEWKAEPDYLPLRSNITRVRLNTGGWTITPVGDGSKSHVVYQFAVDPGGWVPSFAVNMGNEKGVGDTFRAVEKEAQRRRDERLAKQARAAKEAKAAEAKAETPSATPAPAVAAP
ncbi:MAG: hypothetical protein AB1730_28350 [Myxococcota bacterium]